MRIDRLDIYYVSMPLIKPWRTAYGEDAAVDSVLVRATSGEHSGWSEATPFFAPHYVSECAGTVFYLISEVFGPHVVGREYETAAELNRRLAYFKGNSFAKAAIEICWWTLQRKITGTPLHRLLGGQTRELIAGTAYGVGDSIEELLGDIQKGVDAGFPRIKLKSKPGWDVNMLEAVSSAFPDFMFHIDCNSGYTLADLDTFKQIDRFGLAFIEQPLPWDDLIDHAELARQIGTPICLDESIRSVEMAEQAVRIGACQYINIKPGRSGGFFNCLAIHDLCRDQGIPVWIGGMLESAVGVALCIELATLPNFTYPGDITPSSTMYAEDLGSPPQELTENLTFRPYPDDLSEPIPERLERLTLRRATVRPGV